MAGFQWSSPFIESQHIDSHLECTRHHPRSHRHDGLAFVLHELLHTWWPSQKHNQFAMGKKYAIKLIDRTNGKEITILLTDGISQVFC
jgi:hypothetical protein